MALYQDLVKGYIDMGANIKHQTFDIIEQILTSLPGISIGDTIDYFDKKGVYCNCDVYNKSDCGKNGVYRFIATAVMFYLSFSPPYFTDRFFNDYGKPVVT